MVRVPGAKASGPHRSCVDRGPRPALLDAAKGVQNLPTLALLVDGSRAPNHLTFEANCSNIHLEACIWAAGVGGLAICEVPFSRIATGYLHIHSA